jgi:hypothetical protein
MLGYLSLLKFTVENQANLHSYDLDRWSFGFLAA